MLILEIALGIILARVAVAGIRRLALFWISPSPPARFGFGELLLGAVVIVGLLACFIQPV